MQTRWVGMVAATLLVLVPSCGGDEDTAVPSRQEPEGTTTSEPSPTTGLPSIVFAGDSVMRELAAGLAAALEGQASTSYVGMATAATNEAAVDEWSTRMAEDPPDLVVVQVGTWEVNTPATLPDGVAGYGEALRPLLDVLTAATSVLWLGHPALQAAEADTVLDQLATQWQALPQSYERVAFLDAGAAVEGDGEFQTVLTLADGRSVLVRQIDGRHLCPDGVVLEGRVVLDELERRFDLDVDSSWEAGSWREDPTAFEHPELCPADLGEPLTG